MKSNISITKYKRAKSVLEKKLMTEGLTKDEKYLLDNVNSILKEGPMFFDPEQLGSARPSTRIQSKIEGGELPISKIGLTQAQVDFFTSEAFKESVLKLEKLIGQDLKISGSLTTANTNLKRDAQTAFRTFMGVVGELMGELISLQVNNKEELEEIAKESVEKITGIDNEFFNEKLVLDGQLSVGFLRKLNGMKEYAENISDEDIVKKFANIDDEKLQKLEELKNDFESMGVEFDEEKLKTSVESTFKISDKTKELAKQEFSDEVSRQIIVNIIRQGMSLAYSNAYELCEDKIAELPDGERILELSNVIQPIMVHMYWLFEDVGSVATSGGGQIGQVQVLPPKGDTNEPKQSNEPEQPNEPKQTPNKKLGPFVIQAKASTLPLLVHELVKGVAMFFTSSGEPEKQEQRMLARKSATSLEIEAYNFIYSPGFWDGFYKNYSKHVRDINEQRQLTPFLLKLLSERSADDMKKLSQYIATKGMEQGEFADNFFTTLIKDARTIKQKMEQNPKYMTKKQYGDNEEQSNEDMDWMNEI